MKVDNTTFYFIADNLDWKQGDEFILGEDYNPNFKGLMNKGQISQIGKQQIPTNIVVNEMNQFLSTNQDSELLGDDYHYDVKQTLNEAIEVMNRGLILNRELIFEQIRLEQFPDKPSRQKCMWVFPQERETLQLRMSQLKTPNAKIYELNLTGKIHRSDYQRLELISISPAMIAQSAIAYWNGTGGNNAPTDEVIFEGKCQIAKVIDANSVGAMG